MSPARALIREAAKRGVRFIQGPYGLSVSGRPMDMLGAWDLYLRSRSLTNDIDQHAKGAKARGDRFLASLMKRIAELPEPPK